MTKTCNAPIDGIRTMPCSERGRPWIAAALSLAVASLGLGTYLSSLDVAGGSLTHTPQIVAVRDDSGHPICRRNVFADPQRPLVRIGHNCQ